MARNLVVVRAGDSSLHQAWLGTPEIRNWDIIINYFGDNPDAFRDRGTTRVDSKGPKWPALYDTLRNLGEMLEQYDYVWLPDDDLESDVHSINKFFEICNLLTIEMAQPSLSLNSYATFPFTFKNKAFMVRFNNFVEIMAPCFSRSFLKRCLPTFSTNLSGWGLDFLWATWINDPTKLVIVDAVSVRHTRPVGGPNYALLKERGISPEDEMNALFLKEGIVLPKPMTRGGITLEGNVHTLWNGGQKELIAHILKGQLPELAQHSRVLFTLIEPILDVLSQAVTATNSNQEQQKVS